MKVEELEEYLHNVQGNQLTVKGIEIVPPERQIKQKLDKTLDDAVTQGKELTLLREIPPESRTPQQKQRIEELVATQQKIMDECYCFVVGCRYGGTQSLMSSFYALVPSGKLTKAQALRQAQIALITGKFPVAVQQQGIGSSLSHPYYWAPFILIGNGL